MSEAVGVVLLITYGARWCSPLVHRLFGAEAHPLDGTRLERGPGMLVLVRPPWGWGVESELLVHAVMLHRGARAVHYVPRAHRHPDHRQRRRARRRGGAGPEGTDRARPADRRHQQSDLGAGSSAICRPRSICPFRASTTAAACSAALPMIGMTMSPRNTWTGRAPRWPRWRRAPAAPIRPPPRRWPRRAGQRPAHAPDRSIQGMGLGAEQAAVGLEGEEQGAAVGDQEDHGHGLRHAELGDPGGGLGVEPRGRAPGRPVPPPRARAFPRSCPRWCG